jgi:DNA-binding response OmpR family regulator
MTERSKPVVFLAEDDETQRHSLRDALVDASFDVVEASDGVQLLALLETNRDTPPAVIITDVDMPSLGGLEVLALLRSEGNQVAVIVITGNDAVSVRQKAENFGATLMRKPIRLAPLIETLRSLRGVE